MSKLKNNSELTDQWMVKLETEQVKGPYSTDAVCKMILEGIFSGQEDISVYPDGDWRPLSKQSEFYESLLESLENPVERDEKNAVKMDAETVIRQVAKPQAAIEENLSNEIKSFVDLQNLMGNRSESQIQPRSDAGAQNNSLTTEKLPNLSQQLLNDRDQQLDADLLQIKKQQHKEIKKLLPLLVIVGFMIVVGIYFLLKPAVSDQLAWALRAPQKNKPQISAADLKSYKARSFALIKNEQKKKQATANLD